ncbi:MAG TPA: hypothetical protein VNA24_20930 [Hyalangium sp.]|nr:hypothetical protein [Hyalangium sp.]
MRVWRALLCCGVMLVPVGCVHTSDKPTVRTKGGDSATARIPILIANGQLAEAEQLLLHAIAAGLISKEAATRMQEAIRQRQEQQSQQTGPKRPPPVDPWVDPEDPSGERRKCGTELPNHPVCQDLPENYTYHSAQQALDAMKQRLGVKNLILHKSADTITGPCPFLGKHFNVRSNGERAGSIVCCPCCVDADPRPIEWTQCRIVW